MFTLYHIVKAYFVTQLQKRAEGRNKEKSYLAGRLKKAAWVVLLPPTQPTTCRLVTLMFKGD